MQESTKMSKLEAAILGGEAAKIATARLKAQRVATYNLNPKKCKFCDNALTYERRHTTFCNCSCAAAFNNQGVRRHGASPNNCLNCGAATTNSKSKYCCQKCQRVYEYKEFIHKWQNGLIDGGKSHGEEVSNFVRRWLEETQGKKCSICGITEWQGKVVPLVLDHIDGHSENNRPENLRFVCRNCDGQLPTFAGKNVGNGRKHRRERIREENQKNLGR